MFLTLLLSQSILASAEPSADLAAAPEDCGMTSVWVTSPAPLATDVPVDVVPAALVTESSCGAASWTATLIDASTGAEVVSVTHAVGDGQLIEVDPGADLSPETTYTLRFEPDDGGGELTEIGFTTGSGTTVGLDGAPVVASTQATWSEESGLTLLSVQVEVASAAEGQSIVTFGSRGGEDLAWTSSAGPATVLLQGSNADASAPSKVCITARQRDYAGNWTESEEDCVAPEIVNARSGCNVVGGAPIGGLLGLALAVGLARRKPDARR
ncbi:MAG: hypothetical protein Q8P41_13315 [Pseudomonadota bacterium]|nr:hypothetical protein [Pseudomonadota bacterium]